LLPQAVPPHAFALEDGALRGASFRRERSGLALRELHSVALPAGTLAGGPLGGTIGDAETLGRAVADLVHRFAAPPKHASLVLPDLWARALAVELGALPERAELRTEVLRFRLKKLVPFRVDELRVAAAPIVPVAGQEDPIRALVLYAAEGVCAAFESAFDAAGVALGQITNATLARLGAVAHAADGDQLLAFAAVEPGGFTLVFARAGEPVVWRQKSFGDRLDEGERAPLLAAELRLTRTFLDERMGGQAPTSVVLAAPPGIQAFWTEILEGGLEVPVVPLAASDLPLAGAIGAADARELAALVGAASREVV